MTSPDHPTGTDRIAEAVKAVPQATHIVNIQGDEPLIDPALIDELAAAIGGEIAPGHGHRRQSARSGRSGGARPERGESRHRARRPRALFFPLPLPYFRNPVAGLQGAPPQGDLRLSARVSSNASSTWPPSPLEQAESLEQLRALENGATIRSFSPDDTSPGVDTLEQAARKSNDCLAAHTLTH